MEYQYKYIIQNGTTVPTSELKKQGKITIYEVIRVINKIPLFIENHLSRLKTSAQKLNKTIPYSKSEFNELIHKLINSNQVISGNLKISLNYLNTSEVKQTILGFIPHNYPSILEYTEGVKTITSIDERLNPSVKMQNDTLRNKLNKLMEEENAYEVVLVHPDGFITECSRSNIFFIKGNMVQTSPDELVLAGITRDYIISICKEKYDIICKPVQFLEISNFDAAFISGTSPKVLPIKSINNHTFNLPNKIIQDISHKYDAIISSYIATHQK